MDAKQWHKKIKANTKAVGTYKEQFEPVILTLADILAERDRAFEQYIAEGAHPLIVFESDRGAKNEKKNPLLHIWSEFNAQALTYWRDLGLTPAGLKKIDEAPAKKETSALSKVLEQLEG